MITHTMRTKGLSAALCLASVLCSSVPSPRVLAQGGGGGPVVPNPLLDGHGSCNVATMDQVDGCDYRGFRRGADLLTAEASNACFRACSQCCDSFGSFSETELAAFAATCRCLELAVIAGASSNVALVDALLTCGGTANFGGGRIRRLARAVELTLRLCGRLQDHAIEELQADCRVSCNDSFPPQEPPPEPPPDPEPGGGGSPGEDLSALYPNVPPPPGGDDWYDDFGGSLFDPWGIPDGTVTVDGGFPGGCPFVDQSLCDVVTVEGDLPEGCPFVDPSLCDP